MTLLTVYGETSGGMPPTAECKATNAKGLDPYLDGSESGKTLFTYVNNYGEGGFGTLEPHTQREHP